MDYSETEEAAIARVLDEEDVDAEHMLAVLVRTLVSRHVDCELRKMGRRDAWTPGNERTNSLVAVGDALYEAKCKLDAAGDNPVESHVIQAIQQILMVSQFHGEYVANIIDDDGEERPIMRLVTD
jgi:hypothetical protein